MKKTFLKMIRFGIPFYQTCDDLNIKEGRDTTKRFKDYGLKNILKKNHEVLDIGCNSAFFSLETSKFVKQVDAFDNKFGNVLTAKIAKFFLKRNNIKIFRNNVEKFQTKKKYDIVYSFAIHHWINMPFESYIKMLKNLTKKDGMVFFESHDLNNLDKDFEQKKEIIKKHFKIKKEINMEHDGNRFCLVLT